MTIKDESDESGSSGSGHEPTQIDLGDDLVEKTAVIPGHSSPSNVPPATGVEDRMESARILLVEGFPEEAKKILRQILVDDSENRESRKLLEQIHESELKQMFGSAEPMVRKSLLDTCEESIPVSDSEEIVRLLERDIRPALKGAAKELSFFSDVKLLEGFAVKLERQVGDSPGDRVDLAIGFIEMGLYPVALRLLQPLLSAPVERDRLNAVALNAYSCILGGESYEAISVLQPVLNDNDIAKSAKTEVFYLMGRALQSLALHAEAIDWFMQAQENEPGYRDCSERISRSEASLSPRR